MTSVSDKDLWITGGERIRLITDLVQTSSSGSPRKHDNDFEMIVLQLAYVAYKFPNQWICLPFEVQELGRTLDRLRDVFKVFGDFQNRTVLMQQNPLDNLYQIMVQTHSPDHRSMSGYQRHPSIGKFII